MLPILFIFRVRPPIPGTVLKHLENKITVLYEKELYTLIQSQIRGGVSQCVQYHAIVRDRNRECILYLDINALYSKVMQTKLPIQLLCSMSALPENWS